MNRFSVSHFLKGLVSTSSGTFAAILFHFLSIMVIVKHISKEDFGLYMLILAVIHFLRILGGLGLDITLVKFISGKSDRESKEAFLSIIVVRIGVALLLSALIYLFGRFFVFLFDATLSRYIIFLPLLFILTSFKELFFYLFQALFLFRKYAIINILSAGLKFLVIILLLHINRLDLDGLIYLEMIAPFATLIAIFFFVPFEIFKQVGLKLQTLKSTVRFALPLYLNNLLTFVYNRTNIFMIGALLDPIGVAYYSVAGKIAEGFHRMFSSFIMVYFPSLSRLFSEKQNEDAEKVMNKSLVYLSIGGIFLALLSFLFRDGIIRLVFSESYLECTMAFALLMVDFQITIVSYTMGYSLVSAGYSSVPVKVNTVASVVNIAANFVLIPKFGFVGAVYSRLIMNVIAQFGNYFYLVKAGVTPNIRKYLSPLFMFLAAVGISYFFEIETFLAKTLLIAGYVGLCFVLFTEMRTVSSFSFRYVQGLKFKAKSIN